MDKIVWIILLLAVALVLGVSDIFIPSLGFFTLIACLSLIVSAILAFGIGPIFGFCYLLGLMIFAPIVISILLRIAPKTAIGRKVFLETAEEPPTAADPIRLEFRELIGRRGRAASLMMPSGRVEINGKFYDALCDIGPVDCGAAIEVVRSEQATLIVQPIRNEGKKTSKSLLTDESQQVPDPFEQD